MKDKIEKVKVYLENEEFTKREYCMAFVATFLFGMVLGMLIAPKKKYIETNTYECVCSQEDEK